MIDAILNKLDSVKSRGYKTWIACCPAHDDKTPSLAITLLDDGRILLKCFAGCAAIEIVHSIGLEVSDLFPKYGLNPMGTMRRLENDYQQKQAIKQKLEKAKTIWLVYECAKERGETISPDETDLIMDAYQTIKEYSNAED